MTSKEGLYVGFIQAPLTALGPGRRVGLWLRGCDRRCSGCLSTDLWEARPESWRPIGGLFEEINGLVRETEASGLTISGGEPFQQAEGLRIFLSLARSAGLSDVLIYSGFLANDLLAAHPWLPGLAAVLVDGPYEQGRPSREPWRGSVGQTFTLFRPDLDELYKNWRNDETRKVQIILSEPGFVRLLGIPGQGDYNFFEN